MDPTASAIQTESIALKRNARDITIEYRWISPEKKNRPLIIFLHEGLGCAAMWKDWPDQACAALDCRGMVYSRYGYGQSSPRAPDDQRTARYVHEEATQDLPAILDALGLDHEKPILFGHSDGASIALLFAAAFPDRVQAIAVAAPHLFVEGMTIASMALARQRYTTTDLKQKLGHYHRDADSVFYAWNDIWLSPAFRQWNIEQDVAQIRCPILALQGTGDEYASLDQISGIKRLAPQTQLAVLHECGHTPHRDQPEAVIAALRKFLSSVA